MFCGRLNCHKHQHTRKNDYYYKFKMIENIYKKQNSQDIKSITSNKVVMKPETDWVHGDRCVVCDS